MKWKTAITKIEDEQEIIRGYNLQKLVEQKSFVEVIFLLLKGRLPNEKETRMLNALFAAGIDHGVGAPSATVARTVASTGNSLHAAVAAGILAMGELHGSAIEAAAKFFQENRNIVLSQSYASLQDFLNFLSEQRTRVPGYGHKVLKHDHRSDTLFAIAKETGFYGAHCEFAIAVGEALNKISKKILPLNIDGAMGAIVSDMGFDWKLAKGFFIIGRVPGLVAQVYEEMTSGEGVKRLGEDEIEYVSKAV